MKKTIVSKKIERRKGKGVVGGGVVLEWGL